MHSILFFFKEVSPRTKIPIELACKTIILRNLVGSISMKQIMYIEKKF